MRCLRNLGCFLLLYLASSVLVGGSVLVSQLKCEFAQNPMGVDVPRPRLSWQIESRERGQLQSAYQILVASELKELEKNKGNLWDSGRVKSDACTLVPYKGKPLTTSKQVFWKVRAWDKDGRASRWSAPASWTMGILSEGEWKAHWIGHSTNSREMIKLGYHAETSPKQVATRWVQVDLGRSVPVDQIVLWPMDHQKRKGFGFPHRFKVELSSSAGFEEPINVFDKTDADFESPATNAVVVSVGAAKARFVRVTATKLWQRDKDNYVFALCELEVISGGKNVALRSPVSFLDTIENYGWGNDGLTDGRCGELKKSNDPQTLALRREFQVRPGLTRAVLHVCGLGCYEFLINGQKVGDSLFPGGWTKYDKTCLYDSYDVTEWIRQGENAAGILLGNGMYNVVGGRYKKFLGTFGPLKAIAEIHLQYGDGTVETVRTSEDWRMHPGPITFSCVYGGEDFDARLEQKGWAEPGFRGEGWEPVLLVPGPGGALRGLSCSSPPIRTFEVLKPVKVTELKPGVRVFDLGQNVSLMPRVRARGPSGAQVRIIPAELVHEDGSVDRQSCGHGAAWWQYTLRGGGGTETYFPKFYYHGSRYLQVECSSPDGTELPHVEIEGVVVHADCEAVGEFECSNELFNRVRRLVRWAQRSNMMTVMTDCPHREKLGWLEENHLNGPSLRYEFNLARLFTKNLNDMADSQHPNGLVPDIAPEYVRFNGGFLDSPEWGSACVLVPWQQYLFHGDIELLRRYYPLMERYVAYLGSRADKHIVSHGLGDWYDIGPNPPGVAQLTPIALTATAFYYYDAHIMARAAELLGYHAKAAQYGALAQQIKTAFNAKFFKADSGTYADNSQTGNAISFDMELADAAAREGLINAIVRDVQSRGNALTAGDVGYRYLLRALAEGGRSDVIHAMNNQSEKPGYGFQLKRGATALTEAWDARPQSSNNHFMLGQIMEWFYHDLAGIQPCIESPGFKKVRIKPAVLGELDWVRASYHSEFGLVCSHWERKGGALALKVTIPPNATGEVHLPAGSSRAVTEGGKPIAKAKGIKLLRAEKGMVVLQTSSGQFEFEVGD